ncbi:MAG TPA: phosphate ABC transporter substrate-binding protein PstS [Rhodoblastus sp.]|nr:phosphate ABC transporter substrate-binding protein PstS [Rhodoblastus sp.]
MAFRYNGLFAAALVASAGASLLPATAAPTSVELRGAGSTFAAPLIEAWIKTRSAVEPGVVIHYNPVGSSAGVHSFVAGDVEFAATDRPLTADEVSHASGGVAPLPITAGMVVVPYNLPKVSAPLRLSRETLADIFSGAIHEWNDPKIRADNPGVDLPARTIALITRREGSGTTFAFTSYLSAISPSFAKAGPGAGDRVDWPKGAMAVLGNEGVAARIAITEYSIGYAEYGFAQRLALKTALLQNRDGGFVAANADSGAAALTGAGDGAMPEADHPTVIDPTGVKAYPIVTFSWLLLHKTYRTPEVVAALRGFVGFGLSSDGQGQGANIGYVALPAAAVERAQMVLRSLQ